MPDCTAKIAIAPMQGYIVIKHGIADSYALKVMHSLVLSHYIEFGVGALILLVHFLLVNQ